VTTARVVVIGGGIAGASTAFALAVRGADVVLIDDARPGQATAAGAGIIQPWSTNTTGPSYELPAEGASYYPRLLEHLKAVGVADVGYRVAGALVVDIDPAALDAVEQLVRARTVDVDVAGSVDRLDAQQARALFPPLAPDLEAVYISGGARVDGQRLRAGLVAAAQRLSVEVVHASGRLRTAPGGGWRVHTQEGEIGADAAVVAVGAWSNSVLEPVGYRLAVEPQRGQLVHLHLAEPGTGTWPSVLPLASHYLVPFDEGRIVVGATREPGVGFDPRVTASGMREVLDTALSTAPGLSNASVVETRVGLRPVATQDIPFVGPVPGLTNLYVATGFGAVGLTVAPVAGEALAQTILTGSSSIELAPFAPPALAR
jgi:D-amino-acid dehydrogenase